MFNENIQEKNRLKNKFRRVFRLCVFMIHFVKKFNKFSKFNFIDKK